MVETVCIIPEFVHSKHRIFFAATSNLDVPSDRMGGLKKGHPVNKRLTMLLVYKQQGP